MTKIAFFREDAYTLLVENIKDNCQRYFEQENWLDEFFQSKGLKVYFEESQIDIQPFKPEFTLGQKDNSQKSKEDIQNSILLHSTLKELPPSAATNRYFWAYLCHEHADYIIDRWNIKLKNDNVVKAIERRFFAEPNKGTSKFQSLYYNALARLWWCGHFTYDSENKEDPYFLTKILLAEQETCKDFLDTFNRMKFSRTKGVLLAIAEFKEKRPTVGITGIFRECNKFLNRHAAVFCLDSLTYEEIKNRALNFMIHYYDNQP